MMADNHHITASLQSSTMPYLIFALADNGLASQVKSSQVKLTLLTSSWDNYMFTSEKVKKFKQSKSHYRVLNTWYLNAHVCHCTVSWPSRQNWTCGDWYLLLDIASDHFVHSWLHGIYGIVDGNCLS